MLSLLDARPGCSKLLISQLQFDEEHLPVGGTLFIRQTVLMLYLQQDTKTIDAEHIKN